MTKTELVTKEERAITYVPLGEESEIKISLGIVRSLVAVPTKSGKLPSDRDLSNFVMLCKSRRLNPFTGDAYLVGYDSKDGPKYSLITSIAALRKRAESNPAYDGCDVGLIVLDGAEAKHVDAQCWFGGGQVVGAWAIAYRGDHERPYKAEVKMSVYSSGRSRWAVDPEGMVCKCAEAAALRRAFPSEVAGLYLTEELDRPRQDATRADAADPVAAMLAAQTPIAAPNPEAVTEPQGAPDDGGPSDADLARDGALFDKSENLGD